jgi:carbonic anhydrase
MKCLYHLISNNRERGIKIKVTGLVILTLASLALAIVVNAAASEDITGPTADEALKMLVDGNARFVSGNAIHPDQSAERLASVVSSQHPFAVIVSCSDSRIPPEIVFDQGVGDVFVIRTAGEVMDDATIGSIEYAVEHLGVPLVVVMGHDSCGAVKATIEGEEAVGHIASLVEAIKPVVKDCRAEGEYNLLNRSIDANTEMVVGQLTSSEPILKEFSSEGKLKIVSARYHLDTGAVEFSE